MYKPNERLKRMLDNKNNALRAYLEKADSAILEQKLALRHAWEEAEHQLLAAQQDGLKSNSSNLDNAVGDLDKANKATKEALDQLKTVVEVLNKVQQALVFAGKVLMAAA